MKAPLEVSFTHNKYNYNICKFSLQILGGLMEHMRRSHKTASKKHTCSFCPFVTQLQFRLQKHIEKKHPEKLKHCSVCSFSVCISSFVLFDHINEKSTKY